MKKFQLLLLLIFTGISFGFSQNDYKKGIILTKANDSIRGFINVKSNINNSKTCEFTLNIGDKPTIYTPNDLIFYQIDPEKKYVSKKISIGGNEFYAFVEILVDGIVDLYYYQDRDKDYYFIEKDNKMNILSNDEKEYVDDHGQKSLVKSNLYKGTLLYLFQDAKGLNKSINNTNYSYKSLIDITEKYHHAVCSDYDCMVYKKSTKSKISIEPVLSYSASFQNMKDYSGTSLNLMPALGINIRVQAKKILYLWSYSFGLSISQNSFYGEYNFTPTYNKPYDDKISTAYSIIRIPFTVQYTFPEKLITPFFYGGFNFSSLKNYTYQIDRYTKFIHGYVIDSNLVSNTPSKQVGMILGAGLKHRLNKNTHLIISANYEYRANIQNTGYILEYTYYNSVFLNAGISIDLF